MKTETEKAIEFCGSVMYQEDVCDCEEDDLLYNEEMRKVIALLQQGEKYEKMFNEVEMKFKTLHTDYETGEEYYSGVINATHIKEIKQRYFPEELPDEKTTKL